MSLRPAKTQISLGIPPVWSESSLCAQWAAKDQWFLHVDSEDSDQTGRMPRLIWVLAGRTLTFLVLSCRGSCLENHMRDSNYITTLSYQLKYNLFSCPQTLGPSMLSRLTQLLLIVNTSLFCVFSFHFYVLTYVFWILTFMFCVLTVPFLQCILWYKI